MEKPMAKQTKNGRGCFVS